MASELDEHHVLDVVVAGKAPAGWTVYRAQKSYFYGEAFISLFIAAIPLSLAGLLIWLLITLGTEPPPPPDGTGVGAGGDTGDNLLLAIITLACAIVGVILIGRAVLLIRSSRSANSQLLILTPNGFIARTPEKIVSAQYSDISAVSMHVTHSKYDTFIRLHMVFRPTRAPNGVGYMDWQVDPRFGPKDEIAQAIIAGHARWQASQ